jgi:peptidoglycan/xylan/chitin deacetylase (PgdA/CDA1 family)
MKNIYLTIDDAPTEDMMGKINFLVGKDIPAIWFCIGKQIEQNPEPVIYALKKGFIIGNHSYSHPHFSKIPLDEAKEEILKTDKIIDDIYIKAGVKREKKYFRFPYGDRGAGDYATDHLLKHYRTQVQELQKYLISHGYINPIPNVRYWNYFFKHHRSSVDLYWTFDCLDWALGINRGILTVNSLEDLLERIDKYFLKHKTNQSDEVIIIHDHMKTTALFEPLINKLLSHNLHFVLPH